MTFDAPAITHHRVWLARLLSRIGAAAVLAAVVLGGLAFAFDEQDVLTVPLLVAYSFWFFPYLASYGRTGSSSRSSGPTTTFSRSTRPIA